MDTTVSDPLVGRVLDGRYEVEGRLARGGMATVYQGTDKRLDRTVALKVMHPGLADDADFVARFIREAKSAARLSHPNVVAVFDQGADDGHVFLAMEYVAGRTLRDLLRERHHLAPGQALGILESVLAALGAAHQAGLIHRDVKPENVLLADDGRVKVADFGLARAVSAATSHTSSTGVLIGTVAYLSPEQVSRGVADARSDVYAAGILLYEMLTGVKPFEGDSPIQVAYRHVHEDVPPPSAVVPGLPRELDELVQRATSRDPDRRPADANRMLAEVVAVRRALPAEVLGTALASTAGDVAAAHTMVVPLDASADRGDTGLVRRPRRRRRGLIAFITVLLLAALLGAAAWYVGEGPGRFTTAPSLLGMSEAAAKAKATGLGFTVRMDTPAFDETVPAGFVLRTDPPPNHRIRKGGVIKVTLSKGPERYQVPVLVNLTEAQAVARLNANHLTLGEVTEQWSDSVRTGVVMSSSPPVGAQLKRGTAVDLVVSKGPRPVNVPDVVNDKVGDAKRQLSSLGFTVQVSYAYNDTVDKDRVISQSPDGGQAPHGSTVRIVVSKGPPLVPVPDVLGMPIRQATQVLQQAGFEVNAYGPGSGRVFSQSPRGGKAPKGSAVTLFYI